MNTLLRRPLLGLLLSLVPLAACDRPLRDEGGPQAQQSGPAPARGGPAQGSVRQIKPDEVASQASGARVVDVREPDEFNDRLGHIPGAELVPLGTLAERAASWDRGAELIVVCRSGARSRRAAGSLVAMGFQRVADVSGGMLAYSAAGLPVERR